VKPLPHVEPVETIQRIQLSLEFLTYPFLNTFFYGEPDGLFGPDTTWCVRAFQRAVFLGQPGEWDAHLGPRTLRALDESLLKYGCPRASDAVLGDRILASVAGGPVHPHKPKPRPRPIPTPKRKSVRKRVEVSLPNQKLQAFADAQLVFDLDCVSGDASNPTPTGHFSVFNKDKSHVSRQFNVPMHYAMFFKDGKAIHQYHGITPIWLLRRLKSGTDWIGSHGCVRLSEDDAAHMFDWTPMQTPVNVT
jgi:peptidoglycan hydrolase-like protein with peptidoglycan-binding domain